MAYKVKNFRFANDTVYIAGKAVDFDSEGIGEIESEQAFNDILELPHFFSAEPKEEVEETDSEGDGEGKEEEEKDEVPKLVSEAEYNHAELDETAKNLGMDMEVYKKDVKKDVKVTAINKFIMENF